MKPVWLGLVLVCGLCILNACGGASGAGAPQPVATHFSITSQPDVAVGTAFKITVTALDASNNAVSTYSGTVHFTSSDAQAVLPAATRLTNGTGTFSVTFLLPGSQTITATDSNSSSITGTTNPITVLDSATLFFVTAPLNSTEGFAFNISVTATDAANHTVTSYTGTIHFTSSDGKALLPPDSTLTNGTGTFPVTLNSLGAQTITATDTTTASITGTSSSITVVTNVATQLSVGFPPSGWSPGNLLHFTVTALDAANNTSATYTGTVHFSSSDAVASLPSSSALTNGTANFAATLNTIGHQTITATDTVNASITGTSRSINIAKLTISSRPPNGVVGVQFSAGTENCTQQPGFLLQASGGWAFHGLYSFFSSSLPPGLQIGEFAEEGVGPDCRSGPPEWILYGTPTQAGTFNSTISVTDNEPVTTSTTYMITISSGAAEADAKSSLKPGQHYHYKLIDVGTLGGPAGGLFDSQKMLTSNGTLVGWADTAITNPYPNCFNFNFSPDCLIQHGFQWKDGVLSDLGALPVVNSTQAEAINEHGLIVGQSGNGLTDPFLGVPATDAVAWSKGKIFNLGTLGGYQGVAFDVNNAGQATGMATNTIPDPYSLLGGTQSRAFLWDGLSLRDLGTLGGPDSFGQFINNRGQVAGFAYKDSTPGPLGFPACDPFLWDKNSGMKDLGNFGGTQCNPFRLNDRGELVGTLSLAGEQEWHPFLWNGEKLIDLGNLSGTYGQAAWVTEAGDVAGLSYYADGEARAVLWAHEDRKIKDLGALEGDNCSIAWAMNEKEQIVGFSSAQEISGVGLCFDNVSTITAIRATLWENGTIVDLNDLIPPGAGLHLVIAKDVNDRGEIAGVGIPPGVPLNNGNNEAQGHDFILIPCDEKHLEVEGCDYSLVETAEQSSSSPPAAASSILHNPRSLPWERNGRFHLPAFGHDRLGEAK